MSALDKVNPSARETMSSVITTNPFDPRFNPVKVTQGKNDPVLVLQKLYHYNNFQNKPLQANYVANKYRSLGRKESKQLTVIHASDRSLQELSPTHM